MIVVDTFDWNVERENSTKWKIHPTTAHTYTSNIPAHAYTQVSSHMLDQLMIENSHDQPNRK